MSGKRDAWSEQEYLVVLALYFETSPKERDKKNPKIIKVAMLLKRSPASIVYRLANYASVDPTSPIKGFEHGGKKVEEFFNKYVNHKEQLKIKVDETKKDLEDQQRQFWIEQYWPGDRDLDNLFAWFHEKNVQRDSKMKAGDRLLIYEVGWHPETKEKGARKLFASATILDKREKIDNVSGGKRWVLKRFLETDFVVPPEYGMPLSRVKEIRNKKGWPQRGFTVDKKTFIALEDELREIYEKYNASVTQKRQASFVQYKNKMPSSFSPSKPDSDPADRLANLEKSSNSHKEILNKLSDTLKADGFSVAENKQIDLMADINGNNWVFEVKSTRDDNYLKQVRHGVAQLLEYRFRFLKPNTKLCLVVQTVVPSNLEWLIAFLREYQITFCWPVPGGFYFAVGENELSFLKGSIESVSAKC